MVNLIICAQTRIAQRSDTGSALADYLATALVAVALVMAVFAVVTHGSINGVLQGLVEKALTSATGLIHS